MNTHLTNNRKAENIERMKILIQAIIVAIVLGAFLGTIASFIDKMGLFK